MERIFLFCLGALEFHIFYTSTTFLEKRINEKMHLLGMGGRFERDHLLLCFSQSNYQPIQSSQDVNSPSDNPLHPCKYSINAVKTTEWNGYGHDLKEWVITRIPTSLKEIELLYGFRVLKILDVLCLMTECKMILEEW